MPAGPFRPPHSIFRIGKAPRCSRSPGRGRSAKVAFGLAAAALSAAVLLPGCPRGNESDAGAAAAAGPAGRVVLFGIDGADWQVIDPLIAAGRMPNMARVVREGARGVLQSMEPSASPALWTTIATGVTPDHHGIHGFITEEGQGPQGKGPEGKGTGSAVPAGSHPGEGEGAGGGPGIRPVTSGMRRAPAFWNILGAHDKKTGVVGWLVTWPAEPVQGFVVSSYLPYVYNWSTGRPLKGTIVSGIPHQTFPEGLLDQLEQYKVRPADLDPALVARFYDRSALPGLTPLDRECVVGFDWSLASDETYRRVARHLFDAYPVDLFAVYFGGVDVASHRFWRFAHPQEFEGVGPEEIRALGGVIDAYYVWMDDALGEYLRALGPRDTLVVLSDHGFKTVHIPDQPATSGHHRLDGILAMLGRGVPRGGRIEGARLVDVLPTILTLLDLPLAKTLEGNVPRGALENSFVATHGRRQVADYSGARPSPLDDTT
ncbi:MAG TPA: alkaline phosphatase family protein, partial [Myxococcaceae bacterium]|nr:alkaline phosphatase family protein [Myxococcaceae bacterium]